ncbi:MAG: hypothetical protein K2X82_15705 [Gemmataceae bacterium]|nr:hypothetical protein [Gemmataceae bacterium]
MPDTPASPAAGATRSPALPSTADAAPYVPVSWLAVAAFLVAALFVLLLVAFGYSARADKKPLLVDWLLVLPAAAVVLSFAARRVIRNAEGTRTGTLFGVDLPAAAWWTAVVGGLGYLAYLFAVDYSIRSEAKGEVERWAGAITRGELTRAFHRTRDPNERAAISPDDAAGLDARYRTEHLVFRQSDLVRLAGRNPGGEFTTGGLQDWKMTPAGIDCTVRGVYKCPEGVFPVSVQLRGSEAAAAGDAPAGRQWQVYLPPAGYLRLDEVRLTPYGWFVAALERQGGGYARQFVQEARPQPARPYAFLKYARHGDDPFFRTLTVAADTARAGLLGTAAVAGWKTPAAFYDETARRLYRLPGGGEPPPDRALTFAAAWANEGIDPPGFRLKESKDVNDVMTVTDDAVEVRSPVEIPLNSGRGVTAAARGRVVVRCEDPRALAELKRLRAEADPDRGATATPGTSLPPAYEWKLVRLESDLKAVPTRQSGGPPGTMGAPEPNEP